MALAKEQLALVVLLHQALPGGVPQASLRAQ